ncbi:MAG TPA: DUF4260 domain-containing protein [Pseudolabrys sp.]|nr:DUF4260 domain-containing protein [Pseudolabrys sp.]
MPADTNAVSGMPRLILRIEGAAVALLAIALYWKSGASWWLFLVLILTPDLSFLGYLGGSRIGALAYNAVHSYVPPAALALVALLRPEIGALPIALIWFAHIGLDRALGYGLKYEAGFGFTHLGRIGRQAVVPGER